MVSRTYPMKIDLNVLEHLGINLYSNVPSVLSEAVANSWDADASQVRIRLSSSSRNYRIVIEDDGIGMTYDEVKERFLTVGYRRRDGQPGLTPKGRMPMGRKGIGKLSLFSIANEIKVETVRKGEVSAFLMTLEGIRRSIRDQKDSYEARALPIGKITLKQGTRITLSGIRKRHTISTERALITRLARRFSVIGPLHGFDIRVNRRTVRPEDRGYYDKLQYIWTYGDATQIEALATHCKEKEARPNLPEGSKLSLTGWLGTVEDSGQLKDDFEDNNNRIAIFVRQKVAQEDILADFSETSVYAKYLIGEIYVDGLDTYDGEQTELDDDAATSSRQRLVEDDPRYIELKKFLAGELQHIRRRWRELRTVAGVETALKIPAVKNWVDGLPSEYERQAKQWIGRINRVEMGNENERMQLVKHAIVAFEFYRRNRSLELLDSIADENLNAVMQLFHNLDELEVNLYGQIVRQRLSVIKALEEKVDQNEKENVIRDYIFDHLWLLDQAWERVEGSQRMETRVSNLFEEVNATLTEEEKLGRVDIRYRKTAGQHVIIELKRPERTLSVFQLGAQINKYRTGMLKILDDLDLSHEPVEFVCILGRPLQQESDQRGSQMVRDNLASLGARILTYDRLLHDAFEAYRDYQREARYTDTLGRVISEIDDYLSHSDEA